MITRRHFLATTAAAGVAGTAVSAPVAAAPVLSPDERIAEAIELIKEAYQEKFPGAPIRICTHDSDGGVDMVMVVPFPTRADQTGIVTYMHNSEVVRREGGTA